MFTNMRFLVQRARTLFVCALTLTFLFAGAQPAGALVGILYVAPEAQGAEDCSSWENACTLQTALGQAESGSEIWVKTGVYYPGEAGDREATFALKNGVALYGGFAGTETSREERNWQTNLTILSGDVDQNDANTDSNSIAETTDDLVGENAYHVVTASSTNATAILDGFVITAGQANHATSYPHFYGGGLYSEGGSPTLANLIFSGNFAGKLGGGIYNGSSSSPTLTNVRFHGNQAVLGGGGMANQESSSPLLEDIIFEENEAGGIGGGAVYNVNSHPTLRRAIFRENTASKGGGMFNDYSSPVLINALFVGNRANDGGGLYNQNGSDIQMRSATLSGNHATSVGGAVANFNSNPTIINAILWGNSASISSEMYNYFSNPSISYSDIQGGYEGEGNLDADPLFADLANGDLHLGEGSPAIDAGSNDAVSGIPTDLEGNERVQDGNNDSNSIVDMGAYEAPPDMHNPTVVSITCANPNPTNETSLNFAVTFSEPVTGVDLDDFTLTADGLSGASLQSVSEGPAIVYTVTALTGDGEGTLRLDVPDTASIADLATNPLSGLPYENGESYTIDRTSPTATSITRLDANPTSAINVRFQVVFSETMAGVDTSDFLLTTTGITNAEILDVSSADQVTYTVTVDTGTGNGSLRLDIPAEAEITDLANNPLTGLPHTSGESYTVNKPAPNLLVPANGAVLPNRRPFFDWRNFWGASAYQLQIARNSAFTLSLVSKTVTPSQYEWTTDLLPKTTYYWRVRAKVGSTYTAWSEIRSFTTGNPPSIPVLSLPASNALVGVTPTFDWANVTLPSGTTFDKYEIQIATDAIFSSPVVAYTHSLADSQYTPTEPLARATKYYWRVRAWNTAGEYSSWSAVRTVRVKYAAPTLQSPADEATNLQPEFAWDAVAGATGYTLQVSKNATFSLLVINKTVTTPWYNHTANLAPAKYYWRVAANGAFGPGEWSEVRWFEAGLAPSVPILASPASNALVGVTPTFDWANVTLPSGTTFDKYEIQIATDAAFSSPVVAYTHSLTASQYTPTEPLAPATKYYWRVRAWTTDGVNSTWSAMWTVRVKYAAPTNAQVSVTDKKPTFSWDAIAGTTSYTLQVSTSVTFGTLLVNRTQSGTSYTHTELASGTYYWRVRANGTYGPGEWYSGSFVVP